jgi:hypothetical protein
MPFKGGRALLKKPQADTELAKADPVLPPEIEATIAGLEAKLERRKQRRQNRVDLHARECAAFEAEKAAWKRREEAFWAQRAMRTAEIAKANDELNGFAEQIRRMKNAFAVKQEPDDDDGTDDDDDNDDIYVNVGGDAAASD